jgi:hypothetical protein
MADDKRLLLFLPEGAVAQLEAMAIAQHKPLNELILEIVDDGLEAGRRDERLGRSRDQSTSAQLISIAEGLGNR